MNNDELRKEIESIVYEDYTTLERADKGVDKIMQLFTQQQEDLLKKMKIDAIDAMLRLGIVASELAARQNDQQAADIIKQILDKFDELVLKQDLTKESLSCGCPRHDENSMCINQIHLTKKGE